MRLLFWHADYIRVEPLKEALKERDKKIKIEEYNEPLVVLMSIEKGDEKFINFAIEEILEVFKKVGAKTIVLYPYAHLSSNLENPKKAREILNRIYLNLQEKVGFVKKAPFGWYKLFEIKVKGHPLSELSKTINEEIVKIKDKKEEKKKEEFLVISEKGEELSLEEILKLVEEGKYKEELKILIEKEALKKDTSKKINVDYNKIFEKFGFEWEELSDSGHLRLNPKATIMFDLAMEFIRNKVFERGQEKGIETFEIKGTNLFSLEEKPIETHAQLFGDRLYTLKTEKRDFVLRYAACFQQFAMIKDWNLSYKHLPLGMLEIADSYRYEQRGEVELLFRTRKLTMPDWHVFCKDEEEAKEISFKIHQIIMEEMEKGIGKEYWLLINVGDREVYDKYKDFIKELAKNTKKPCLICIYPKEDRRYWTINVEYNIIDNKNKVREIGTFQIDIGNGERFNITYKNEKGEEKKVVILHVAILGTIERFLYAIFDKSLERFIKENKKPCLPLWISPIQVRVLPINEKYLDKAKEIVKEMSKNNIRVDLDDRNERINKKIRDAESEWINYVVVIGEEEIENNYLSVRVRETNKEKKYKLEELIREIKEKTKGKPFIPLRMPYLLSKRPF